VLRKISEQHRVSIANVATRWVLDHDFVGAALIGKHRVTFLGLARRQTHDEQLLTISSRCTIGRKRQHRRQSSSLWMASDQRGPHGDQYRAQQKQREEAD
jgi:hypothetical protein